jgi:hypothetical protein
MRGKSSNKLTSASASLVILAGHLEQRVQKELFPLRTIVEIQDDRLGSDAWGRIQGTDSQWYLVKGDKGGPHVRAGDWLGTHIAEIADVLCPTPRIIEMADGQLFFGSQVVEGIADCTETAEILTSDTLATGGGGLKSWLSRVYALDMAINNIDRHELNYLSKNHSGTRRFYAIDFCRCLHWAGSLNEFPQPGSHTRHMGKRIRDRHGFDIGAALSMLDRLMRIERKEIGAIVAGMPREWDHEGRALMSLDWWSGVLSKDRAAS